MLRWPLLLLVVSGCYQVEHPTQWACSVAEPLCPPGQICDGKRCVTRLDGWIPRDSRVDADGTHDHGSRDTKPPDLPIKPDVQPIPCAALKDWTCVVVDAGLVELRCGSRVLYCVDEQYYGWWCGCEINTIDQKDPRCGAISDPYDLCDAAWDIFLYGGCCNP